MSSSSLWPQPKRQFSFLQYTKEERHQFSDPPTTFFLLQYVSILPSLPIPRKSHNIHTNMNKKTLDPVLRNSIQRQRERDRKRERERDVDEKGDTSEILHQSKTTTQERNPTANSDVALSVFSFGLFSHTPTKNLNFFFIAFSF